MDFLKQDPQNHVMHVVSAQDMGAQKAVLRYHLIHRLESGIGLYHVEIQTGRFHQIRVQMANSGHPLIGDHRYGHGKGSEQIALYGIRLSFEHPTTHQKMTFVAPVPQGAQWQGFERDLEGLTNVWPNIKEQG